MSVQPTVQTEPHRSQYVDFWNEVLVPKLYAGNISWSTA